MARKVLYDPFRKTALKDLPEEEVRQRVLLYMLEKLSYPRGHIVIEKALSELVVGEVPKRRVDILVYEKKEQGLSPLLLIECKAIPLSTEMFDQVFGYNHYLKAPFVVLTNAQESYFGMVDTLNKTYTLEPGFPTYAALLSLSR